MSPSFMVTREEEHSTRGRVNLLRAAMSGELPAAELTGERLYAAMDLRFECKACRAECRSSVGADQADCAADLSRFVRRWLTVGGFRRQRQGRRLPRARAQVDASHASRSRR